MVRYYKNNSTDLTHSTSSIWRKWIVIGVMLMFGLVNANAQKCCYSVSSVLKQPPNIYQLNITASHVNSKKGNNKYTAAISFQDGYTIIGEPYSPFNKLSCDQVPGTGTITQYQCDSQDRAMFFVTFELSVRFLPQLNTSITASDVFIFGDKCQNVGFCTDLAAKNVADNTDKISLGPLGTWPKYAVVIGGVILGVSMLIACYFVYKRNRTDDRYRDRSITPGTGNYEDKRLFSPNSLLRDEDLPPPSVEPPKNTLIQFGSVTTHSPERSKSVRNQHQHQQSSLTKSPTRRKKENKDRDHQEIEIYDNIKSDGHGHVHDHGHGDKIPDVAIDISGNDGSGSGYKTRRSKDRGGNNNVNRMSDYSTSDMSKTISVNDNSDVGGDLSDNNNNENKHLSSTSIHRKKSKSSKSINSGERESRRGDRRRSPNSINNNSNKSRRSSTSRGVEEDREGRRVDRATSRGRRSRKNSSSPSKNTSDLRKGPSVRKRQTDHDSAIKNKVSFSDKDTGKNNNRISRSDTNLDRRKSNKRRDSRGDAESDVPLGDKLPLAILAKQKSWKSDDDNVEEDDDTTPLGRISSYSAGNTNSLGATSTSSRTHLMDASTSPEDNNYGSVLDEVLGVIQDDEKLSDVSKEKNNEPGSEEVSIKR